MGKVKIFLFSICFVFLNIFCGNIALAKEPIGFSQDFLTTQTEPHQEVFLQSHHGLDHLKPRKHTNIIFCLCVQAVRDIASLAILYLLIERVVEMRQELSTIEAESFWQYPQVIAERVSKYMRFIGYLSYSFLQCYAVRYVGALASEYFCPKELKRIVKKTNSLCRMLQSSVEKGK